ncbi:MAG: hypothetical protein ACU843_12020 [Gammaproteobacteria bacterium]
MAKRVSGLKIRIAYRAFFCALIFLSISNGQAATFTVFGPENFVHESRKPTSATRNFRVSNPDTSFTLRVYKGGKNNEFGQVSQGTITLNGKQIFEKSDLSDDPGEQNKVLVKSVTLLTANTLTVELGGKAGSGIALEIIGVDNDPPTISATASPAPNAAGWNKEAVVVTFDCSDDISGIAFCSEPVVIATNGADQVVAGTAEDLAGNTATASVTINLDNTAPIIEITFPDDGTAFNTSPVGITGTVTEDLSGIASVTCNDTSIFLEGKAFTCERFLTAGDNLISVQAIDIAGNTSTSSLTVAYVPIPIVRITSPTSLDLFNSSRIVVSGTVDDESATVEVNGIPATVDTGSWTVEVSLQEGSNVITAVARNAAGNVGTASIEVTLDTTPPRVTIDSPGNGFITGNSSITVAGMINDIVVGTVNGEQAQVTVNGIEAQVANRSFLAAEVPLSPGPNTITAIGTDRAGNTASAGITVTFEEIVGEARINLVSGNNQTGMIGTQLAEPLVVKVTDGAGDPVLEKTVIFKVTENNGTLSSSHSAGVRSLAVSTDAQGRAQVLWSLGTRTGAGNNRVEAAAVGVGGSAMFTASALPAAASKINVDSGNQQIGVSGQPLPRPFAVVVTDVGHNRVADVPVIFTVIDGGGSFEGRSAVTVNTDPDGRALAVLTPGLQEGTNNNVVEATFPGNTEASAFFLASGRAAGNPADTKISGVVLDNTDQPIAGVTLRIERSASTTRTDEQGQFVLEPALVGHVQLIADGSTAQRPGAWPTLEFELVTVAGQDNTLGMPIFLLPLDLAGGISVDETTGGTLTLPAVPGFSLTIAPGSATFPDGGKNGIVSVTVVHADKVPMVPVSGQQPTLPVTIQPPGVHFDPPAVVTFPNTGGLGPGEVTELYSFDHDLGSFVSIGPGSVSEDGSVVQSNPGIGILKGGWHFEGNPSPTGCGHGCPDCKKPDGTKCSSICLADDSRNNTACNQFPRNTDVRLGGLTETEPPLLFPLNIVVQIDESCNVGTCREGKCELISDRWGISKIVQAVEGATRLIFGEASGFCLQEPLRQTLKNKLRSEKLQIQCVNRGECDEQGGFACSCAPSPGNYIRLNNADSVACLGNLTEFFPDVTADKNLERTIFHEMLHAFGGLTHTLRLPELDPVLACEKACYGFPPAGVSSEDFDRANPELHCK